MLNESLSLGPPPSIVNRAVERSLDAQPVLFEDLTREARRALLWHVFDDDTPIEWSEEEIVFLHWRLLQELDALSNPATPLEEKIDTLRWVFTAPECDNRPFSFVNCLRVVGCNRLSPTPYFGLIDAEAIRGWIRYHMRNWLDATVARYPLWVRRAILQHPEWVESRLARNPQWINEEIRKHTIQGDLFALAHSSDACSNHPG